MVPAAAGHRPCPQGRCCCLNGFGSGGWHLCQVRARGQGLWWGQQRLGAGRGCRGTGASWAERRPCGRGGASPQQWRQGLRRCGQQLRRMRRPWTSPLILSRSGIDTFLPCISVLPRSPPSLSLQRANLAVDPSCLPFSLLTAPCIYWLTTPVPYPLNFPAIFNGLPAGA